MAAEDRPRHHATASHPEEEEQAGSKAESWPGRRSESSARLAGRRVPEEGIPLHNCRAERFGCPFREWQGAKCEVLTRHKTLGSPSSRQQRPTPAAARDSAPLQGSAMGDMPAGDTGALFKVPVSRSVSRRKTGLPAQG